MEWKQEVNSVSINLPARSIFHVTSYQDWSGWFLVRLTKNWQILIVFESHFARTNSCFCEAERLLADRHQIRRCFARELKIIASDVRRQLARRGKYHLENIKWMTYEKKSIDAKIFKGNYESGRSVLDASLIIHRKYKHHSSWKCSPVITSNTHLSPRSLTSWRGIYILIL